jgi:hypothetical protein
MTMTTEGQEPTSPLLDLAEAWEQTRGAAIEELEQAQAYLGLMLAQLRTRTGDEKDRAYAFHRFHNHTAKALAHWSDYGKRAALDAMQAQGNA